MGPTVKVTVLEKTDEFKRFGGPIQLASNALEVLKTSDKEVYDNIMEKFTFTGDKENGIKDGDGVIGYETNPNGYGVKAQMESGNTVEGDVLIGADGIWSSVRATMRDE